MPQSTNLNVSPYYDDFDANKDFYRVLFRPGYSIQSRELTTLQSILQNQIESIGKNIIKEGSMVVPGEVSFNNAYKYVKISSYSQGFALSQFIGATITGSTTGVVAQVLNITDETSADSVTFYVRYISSGTSTTDRVFQEGEILTTDIVGSPTAVVGITGSTRPTVYRPVGSPVSTRLTQNRAVGNGSAVFVQEGIYYVNGHFVRNAAQTIIVDKYSNSPTCRVGFLVQEDLVTSDEDESLNDNAAGFSNYAAPGAHRLKITLTLVSREIDTAIENNFIELLRIRNGVIERKVDKRIWTELEEILARRTYDESGDYIVKKYDLNIEEHTNTGTNNGIYKQNEDTGLYDGLTPTDSEASIVASISPGKAYVRGYEIESIGTKYKTFSKARQTQFKTRSTSTTPVGSYLNVQNVYGSINVDNVGSSIEALRQVVLYNAFSDSFLGTTSIGRGDVPQTRYLVQIANLESDSTFDWSSNVYGFVTTTYPGASECSASINFVQKLDYDEPVGTNVRGVARTSVANTFVALITLDSGSALPISGSTIDPWAGQTGSGGGLGTPKAVIRRVWELPGRPIGCAHPKYMSARNLSTVDGLASSDTNRDSIFRIGVFDTSSFTTIKTFGTQPVGNFTNGIKTIGVRITGASSGATGVVEASYDGEGYEEIFLSNVKGAFKEGEDVFTDPDYGNQGKRAQGTIIKSGTIKSIKIKDPGTGFSTTTNPTALNALTIDGSVVKITRSLGNDVYPYSITADTNGGLHLLTIDDGSVSTHIWPNMWSFKSTNAKVFSRTPTASILSSGVAPEIEVELWGKTIINHTISDTKSVHVPGGGEFSADTVSNALGFYTSTRIGQVSANPGDDFLDVASVNIDPVKNLKQGDIVKVVDDGGNERRFLVYRSEKSANTGRSRVFIAGTISSRITNAEVFRIDSLLDGVGQNSLVLPISDPVVKTVARDRNKSNFIVRGLKQLVGTIGNNGQLSFTLSGSDQDFLDYSESRYIAVVNTGNSNYSAGDILNLGQYQISRVSSSQGVNSSITFSGIPAELHGIEVKLTAGVIYYNAKPRTKILKNAQVQVSTYNKKEIISLGKTDGLRLNAVYMSPDPDAAATVNDINIVDRFSFDNGQRENVYDICRIIRRKGSEEPSGQLLVDFDYFDHTSNDGLFFSVDSYINPNNLTLKYSDIPKFSSQKFGDVELRDAIDFRVSADTGFGNSTIGKVAGAEDKGELGALSFKSINNIIPIPGESVEFECEFYLPRRDSIFLTKKGTFEVVQGTPSTNPQYPSQLDDAIRLFNLDIPAYTFDVRDIRVEVFNYRRYTMKDIRSLEERIEKMEYYTTLSLLEQDTLNTSIKDAVTGLDRFKSGIVVDNFAGHNIGDTLSMDYKCSIDMQSQQMRPRHFTDQVSLVEEVDDDDSRASLGYKKSGSLVMIDYEDSEWIKNPYATKTINLNPFLQFQYKGALELAPDVDEWKDIENRPDLIVNDNALFDTIQNMADENGVLGTIWNEWQTSWSGSEVIASSTSTDSTNTPFIAGLRINPTRWQRQIDRGIITQEVPDREFGAALGIDASVTSSITARTRTRTRTGTQNSITGFSTITQSFGERVVGTAFIPFMRSRNVGFRATGLKPNTRLYAFFEGIDIGAWVCPDSVYTGEALNSPKGFGQPIVTDASGSISGVLVIPNGFAPVREFTDEILSELEQQGISGADLDSRRVSQSSTDPGYNLQKYTSMDRIIYDTSSESRRFRVGEKVLRLTSSATNSQREDDVDSFAEKEYFAMGLLETTEETIVSTRVPTIAQRNVSEQDTAQFVDGVRTNIDLDNHYFDPVAQTFLVEGFEDGLFLSSFEVFFKTKSTTIPTQAYLTETINGTPGKKIIPFSSCTVQPDTVIRVTSDSAITFVAGETILGVSSGASGTVKNDLNILGITSTTNFSNTVYDLILDNHNGVDFIEGEQLRIQRFPEPTSAIQIAKSTFSVSSIEVTGGGTNYSDATVSISAPDQIGGIQATAYALIDSAENKLSKIIIINPGSGYTTPPSVSIQGNGSGATAVSKVRKERSAVTMGVAISEDASVQTKFTFQSPVYLENNREYAFVVLSNSMDYNMFVSRLGETEIGTTQRVSTQPYLGSLFKSQNSTLWTEDQFEDVKFTLYRAKFNTNQVASITFVNDVLPTKRLLPRPLETNKLSFRGGTSIGESIYTSSSAPLVYADPTFGSNPRIVKITHYNHGMTENDYVILSGVTGVGTGDPLANGVAISKLNTTHQISNVDVDSYCILIQKAINSLYDQATESGQVGGKYVYASQNQQFQVIQPQIGIVEFSSTSSAHTVTALKASAVDWKNPNEYTYDTFDVVPGSNKYLTDNYQILSEINEVRRNNGEKSFKYTVTLSTQNDAVSPILDLDRVNMFVTMNLIDNPRPDNPRFGYTVYRIYPFNSSPGSGGTGTTTGISIGSIIQNVYKVDSNGNRDFLNGSIEAASSGRIEAEVVGINTIENYIDVRYLKIPSSNVNSQSGVKILSANQRFSPYSVEEPGITAYVFQVAGESTDYYIHTNPINRGGYLYRTEEESQSGSYAAKYQTKSVTLENPATNLDVRITANLFDNRDMQVMYKIKPTSTGKSMTELPWRYFNPTFTETSQLKEIRIIEGGSGYVTSPTVTLNPQNGAEIVPVINPATGVLESIVITNRGSGFTFAPEVIIDAATGGAGNAIDGESATSPGSGYLPSSGTQTYNNVPAIYDASSSPVLPNAGSGAEYSITVTDGVITNLVRTASGAGYTTGEVLTVNPNFDGAGAGSGFTFNVTAVSTNQAPTTVAIAEASIFPVDFDEETSGLADNYESIQVEKSDILHPALENPSAFKEYKFTVEDLPEFDSFSVKILMRMNVDGPAFCPKIEDFRAIANI